MSSVSKVVALSTALLISGAAWANTFGPPDFTALYSRNLVNYAGQSGEMASVIHGNPFGAPISQEAIANGLRSPGWVQPLRYTTMPRPATKSHYRLVLLFDPLRQTAGDDQTCAYPEGEPVAAGRGDGTARLVAVFCADTRWASRVEGSVPVHGGPDSPAFRKSLQRAMMEILPPRNPKIDVGDVPIPSR